MDESLLLLLKTSFLKTSQMAYLEGAKDTAAVLYHMNRLLKYWVSPCDSLPLRDEVSALKDYAEVLSLGGDRVIDLEIAEPLMNSFIHRRDILSFVAEEFPPTMAPEWIGGHCLIQICKKNELDLEITLHVKCRMHRHTATKMIPEARIDKDANCPDC